MMPVEGFGQLFEQIRKGVDSATAVEGSSVQQGQDLASDSSIGRKCAEVSAAWYLAGELKIDQPDLTFVSLDSTEWPDENLGCVDGSSESAVPVKGFEVGFSYNSDNYLVRTNQYGSKVAIC